MLSDFVAFAAGEWYCSEECRDYSDLHSDACQRRQYRDVDHLQEYSCSMFWQFLWHMAHVDAERENDGMAMMSQWRLDMPSFWNNNHNKYLILGHRLLSGEGPKDALFFI